MFNKVVCLCLSNADSLAKYLLARLAANTTIDAPLENAPILPENNKRKFLTFSVKTL